jgi:hypothetical protein
VLRCWLVHVLFVLLVHGLEDRKGEKHCVVLRRWLVPVPVLFEVLAHFLKGI